MISFQKLKWTTILPLHHCIGEFELLLKARNENIANPFFTSTDENIINMQE